MCLKEAKTYKEYFVIAEYSNDKFVGFRTHNYKTPSGFSIVTTKLGRIDEGYILVFYTKKEAEERIKQNSYRGQSCEYKIEKIWNSRETNYKWDVKS